MCDLCDDGLILKDNTAVFCDCPRGRERKRNWESAGARVMAEAEKDRRQRARKVERHDYKAEAAGNGERWPGEEG